jgi:hypothetical protein
MIPFAAICWLNVAAAQPAAEKPAVEKPAPAKPAGKTAAAANKPKGRLPAYFKDIVDEKQRDKIYAVQADYNAKIDALEEQIKTLTDQRDAAIENVLSPEQKEKLKKAKEEAASKKKKPKAEDTAKPAE